MRRATELLLALICAILGAIQRRNTPTMNIKILASLLACGVGSLFAGSTVSNIQGDYLEVRSCDVYTGPCFANAEMNLSGTEGMMVWSVREGNWNGVDLTGLSVAAIVKADGTLGNLKYNARSGNAVLIVDSKASAKQSEALANFARSMAGNLISKVVNVQTAPIDAEIGTCGKLGCAKVKAGDLVEVATSCLGGKDHVCGNEETFYPPLTDVQDAYPVYTDLATFTGSGLDVTWQIAGKRSAFLGKFSANDSGKQLALK
jgi:hypothetical protein